MKNLNEDNFLRYQFTNLNCELLLYDDVHYPFNIYIKYGEERFSFPEYLCQRFSQSPPSIGLTCSLFGLESHIK